MCVCVPIRVLLVSVRLQSFPEVILIHKRYLKRVCYSSNWIRLLVCCCFSVLKAVLFFARVLLCLGFPLHLCKFLVLILYKYSLYTLYSFKVCFVFLLAFPPFVSDSIFESVLWQKRRNQMSSLSSSKVNYSPKRHQKMLETKLCTINQVKHAFGVCVFNYFIFKVYI